MKRKTEAETPLTEDIKELMWQRVVDFVVELGYEEIKDVAWRCDDNGMAEKIEITLEYPIYLTTDY